MSETEKTAPARERIAANLAAIQKRIAAACRQAGRQADAVRLVAVTKYVAADLTRLVVEAGCQDLAESRPQSIWAKAAALAAAQRAPRWHLVGHLQRNKIRRTLPLLSMLHSLDSLRLLEAIAAEAAAGGDGPPCDVLVEVNLTSDPGRSGVPVAEAATLVDAASQAPGIRLRGLMGMAGHPDAADADPRRDFARLRGLRDDLAARLPDPAMLDELSMGMSNDFEAAILEGATIVRIGTAIFEGLR
ncbi:MAG: YggS family pyridoxal phosphate-dependent enzyme [Planctomycetota bacterium]|nr:YggS family pyridoxal phosphate-dependent enzyme [Planctomycetota bacterium]MDA1201063.1 YggS family pyridoxal phosphate-dependent enzyme [Planctomycetota bacterium]